MYLAFKVIHLLGVALFLGNIDRAELPVQRKSTFKGFGFPIAVIASALAPLLQLRSKVRSNDLG